MKPTFIAEHFQFWTVRQYTVDSGYQSNFASHKPSSYLNLTIGSGLLQ